MDRIWYQQPANVWEEALPLGNGRQGAMVFGQVHKERIQVNEESIWYGGPVNRINPDAREKLPEIRSLIKEGRIGEAQRLLELAVTACPNGENPYQTLGDITLYFAHKSVNPIITMSPDLVYPAFDYGAMQYKRDLQLSQAVSHVTYQLEDTVYEREFFVSKPADLMVMRFCAKGTDTISFTARLGRSIYMEGVRKDGTDGICLYGGLGEGGGHYSMLLKAKTVGGSVTTVGESLVVNGAREAYLYFRGDCSNQYAETDIDKDVYAFLAEKNTACIQAAMARDYEELKAEHIADHSALYEKVALSLPASPQKEAQPTDERLQKVSEEEPDQGLIELLFQFGRYLMIAGSRKEGLPLTLQGLWNQDFIPAWGAKYTININTEMNYWPVETTNLSECHLPLFTLLKKMLPNGRRVAREMYGARGFVAHHNTDFQGDCAPQDLWYPATYWPMGAAWLCTHVWTHYQYTQDEAFLKEYYPIVLEAALFFVDALQPCGDYLVTNPSSSPENVYILPNGERGAVCLGPTMDNQILRDLFSICEKGAEVLCDAVEEIVLPDVPDVKALLAEISQKKEKLPPTQIGSDGRIMEWLAEYEEEEPGHRHISQLYGLFPSDQISMDETPELAAAADQTLKERLKHGGGHTGWSRAWIMNHYARLWQGEDAYASILKMLHNSTYPNLFDKHPPFQIDGNFGASAAIANMLVQSKEGQVRLLPALPKKWDKGSVQGLCLCGGAELCMAWENGEPVQISIRAKKKYAALICFGEQSAFVNLAAGEQKIVNLTKK